MARDIRPPTIHLLEMLTLLLEQATSDEHRSALEHHVALVRRAGVRETAEPLDRRDIAGAAESAKSAALE